MKCLLITTATVALLGLPTTMAPDALAQTNPPNTTSSPSAAAPAAQKANNKADRQASAGQHIRDDQVRASKFIGSNVYDKDNNKVGDISDVVIDPDGKVAHVIVGVGGFLGIGEKHVALKMTDLKRGQDNKLVLDKSKDELKQMASFDLKYGDQTRAVSGTSRTGAPSAGMSGSSTPPNTATAPAAPVPAAGASSTAPTGGTEKK